MLRRECLRADRAPNLSARGFKILLDICSPRRPAGPRSPRCPTASANAARSARASSTLVIGLEYLRCCCRQAGRAAAVPDPLRPLRRRRLSASFVHLAGPQARLRPHGPELRSTGQAVATLVAMTFNFEVNNELTYRDLRLRGRDLVRGHLSFYLVCTVGALANLALAEWLFRARRTVAARRLPRRGGGLGLELRRELYLHLAPQRGQLERLPNPRQRSARGAVRRASAPGASVMLLRPAPSVPAGSRLRPGAMNGPPGPARRATRPATSP